MTCVVVLIIIIPPILVIVIKDYYEYADKTTYEKTEAGSNLGSEKEHYSKSWDNRKQNYERSYKSILIN